MQRISYTGDLGYEIYCDPMAQGYLWRTPWQAGEPRGTVPLGPGGHDVAAQDAGASRYEPNWSEGRECAGDIASGCGHIGLMNKTPALIILAAGKSRRMRGIDKLMQDVDGTPLLERTVRMARRCSENVIVTLPPPPHPRQDLLQGMDLNIIDVPDADEGMNAGLRRAIAVLPEDTEAAMIILADLPDLTESDLNRVLGAAEHDPEPLIFRGATEGGKPGHPVLFRRPLFTALMRLSGDVGAKPVIQKNQDRMRLVPLPGHRALMDLDTPEDWERWHGEQRPDTWS